MPELVEELIFVFRGQDGGLQQALRSRETDLKRLKTVAEQITAELRRANGPALSLTQSISGVDFGSAPSQPTPAPRSGAQAGEGEEDRAEAIERIIALERRLAEIRERSARQQLGDSPQDSAGRGSSTQRTNRAARGRDGFDSQTTEIERETRAINALAVALGRTEDEARELAQGLRLSATNAAAIAAELIRTRRSGGDTEATFRRLNTTLGVSRRAFDGLQEELGQTQAQSRETNRALRNITDGVGLRAGGALFDFGLDAVRDTARGTAAVVASSVSAFNTFDQELTAFAARSGQTREDLAALEQQTLDLARATSQTPTAVANAATTLLTLGSSAEQVEGRIGAVVALTEATSGGSALVSARAVQQGINLFERFGQSADSLADSFAFLQSTTAIEGTQEFSTLFNNAGGAAANAEVQFEELAASFAAIRGGGISARRGATGLRVVLERLASPTDAAAEALEALGVNAFDQEGNFRGFIAVAEQLNEQFAELSVQERAGLLTDAFGGPGANAIATLSTQLDKARSSFDGLSTDATGAAQRIAEELNASPQRSIALLQSSLEALQIQFGGALSGITQGGADTLRDAIATAGESNPFESLDESADQLQQTLEETGAADALGEALGNVLGTVGDELAELVTEFATFLEENPDAIANFGAEVTELAGGLSEFVGEIARFGADVGGLIGDIAPIIGELVSLAADALEAFQNLPQPVQDLIVRAGALSLAIGPASQAVSALGAAGPLLRPLSTALGGLAGRAGAARTALDAVAALRAGNLTGFTASLKLLGAQLGALAPLAATAAAAMAVVGAAAVGASLTRTKDRIADINGELERLQAEEQAFGNASIAVQGRLKTATEARQQAIANGVRLTEEQREAERQALAQSTQSLSVLQQQLEQAQAVPEARAGLLGIGAGTADRQNATRNELIENLERQIEQTEERRSTLEKLARKPITSDSSGQVAGAIALDESIDSDLGDLEDLDATAEISVDAEVDTTDAEDALRDALASINTEAQSRTVELELEQSGAELDSLEQGGTDAEQAARQFQIEQEFAQRRVELQRSTIAELRQLENSTGDESVSGQRLQAEQSLAQLQIEQRRNAIEERNRLEAEAVREVERTQQLALEEVKASETERTLLIAERELQLRQAGSSQVEIERAIAEESLSARRASLTEQLRVQENFISELEQLEPSQDTEDKIRAAKQETSRITLDLVRTELEAQEQLTQRVIDGIDRQQQRRETASQAALASIERQRSLTDAQAGLTDAIANAGESSLRNQASEAEGERRLEIEIQLAQLQERNLAARQQAEAQALAFAQQRAQVEANIEAARAQAELAKADARGASDEEKEALQQVVNLTQQQQRDLNQIQAIERQTLEVRQESAQESAESAITQARQALARFQEQERERAENESSSESSNQESQAGRERQERIRRNEAAERRSFSTTAAGDTSGLTLEGVDRFGEAIREAVAQGDPQGDATEAETLARQVQQTLQPAVEQLAAPLVEQAETFNTLGDAIVAAIEAQTTAQVEAINDIPRPKQFKLGTGGEAATPVGVGFTVAEAGAEMVTDPTTGKSQLFTGESFITADHPLIVHSAADTQKLLTQDSIDNWVAQQRAANASSLVVVPAASNQAGQIAIAAHRSPGGGGGGNVQSDALHRDTIREMRGLRDEVRQVFRATDAAAKGVLSAVAGIEMMPQVLDGASRKTQAQMREVVRRSRAY